MQNQVFQAGAAQVDITPPLGTVINGDFVPHYVRIIHDPLFAKALVLRKGEITLAFVVVDICAMRKDFIDEVKAAMKAKMNLDPENVMISSTHTHASGSVESLLLVEADQAYRKRLPTEIVGVVAAAMENLRPAKVGFGSVDVPEHVVCRRFYMKDGYKARNPVTGGVDKVKTNPFNDEQYIDRRVSTMDTGVGFLAVRGMDDQWISIVANYSMHYAGDWENGTISADYFGCFARHIREFLKAEENFIGIMTNGTSGEANIWDFLDPHRYPGEFFAKSELIGADIARRVHGALREVQWEMDPALKSWYKEISVRVRKPDAKELEAAKKVVEASDYENIQHIDFESLTKIYAREQVLLNAFPDKKMIPLQAFRIGGGIVGGLGGEFFAETGLLLKKDSPAGKYFTICFSNDYVGYVPPAHEIEAGGYETWRCRSSHLEVDAEEVIRKELLELLGGLMG